MSTPSDIPEAQPPRCWHCNQTLNTVGLYTWISHPWLILAEHCPYPDCWRLLNMHVVPLGLAPPEEKKPQPRIVS